MSVNTLKRGVLETFPFFFFLIVFYEKNYEFNNPLQDNFISPVSSFHIRYTMNMCPLSSRIILQNFSGEPIGVFYFRI